MPHVDENAELIEDTGVPGVKSLEDVKDHVEDFLNQTEGARELSEKCRDYYDGRQWTDDQASKLRSRGQAPIVVNRVKPKAEGLKGLYAIRQSDPKAYPRTAKHEDAAHATTDALRFVAQNNDFDNIKLTVADGFFIEGYSGVIVDVKEVAEEIEVDVQDIPWDRIFFDPHSRRADFSDARYLGYMLWMDESEVFELFPDFVPEDNPEGQFGSETFDDRPKWLLGNKNRKRYRIAYEFYQSQGTWWYCVFTEGGFLVEPEISPFLDDAGEPKPNIELVGSYIDRENSRYSEVAGFLDQQDEINHRRSKALHLLSQRQTFGRQGEPKDVAALKRELAKPDGHVEFHGKEFGKDFGVLPTGDMASGQFELYQDAKGEMDAISFNAQLSGERQGNLSGKAIDRLQQAGTIELNGLYNALNSWEKRVYRQIWARVKQFWDKEKWIRVTDDQDNLRWVGLNSQITVQDILKETMGDESKTLESQVGAAAMLQTMIEAQDPRLSQIVEVRNETAELDVDIILDQSFDSINIQEEQFKLLAQFGQGQDIDIIELIELSQIRGKDELISKIEERRKASAQAQGGAVQIEAAKTQSETDLNKAKAAEIVAEIQSPKGEPVQNNEMDLLKMANDNKNKAQDLQVKQEIANADRLAKTASDIKRAEIEADTKIAVAQVSRPIQIKVDDSSAVETIRSASNDKTAEANNTGMLAIAAAMEKMNEPREIRLSSKVDGNTKETVGTVE